MCFTTHCEENILNKLSLVEVFKAVDSAEGDPLDDDEFLNLEYSYAKDMAEILVSEVDAVFDSTKKIITGYALRYNKDDLAKAIYSHIANRFGIVAPMNMRPIIDGYVERIYSHAHKLSEMVFEFDMRDLKSIEYLRQSDKFYVGKQFGKYSDKVREIIRKGVFETGGGSDDVAKMIQKELGALINEKFHYYENVVRTSSNRVRNWSRIFAYEKAGAKVVTYNAVMDERTSAICEALHGTSWQIEWVISHVEKVLEAGEEKLPEVAPFPKFQDLFNENGKLKDAKTLADMGVAIPPMHGRCRSVLLIEDM